MSKDKDTMSRIQESKSTRNTILRICKDLEQPDKYAIILNLLFENGGIGKGRVDNLIKELDRRFDINELLSAQSRPSFYRARIKNEREELAIKIIKQMASENEATLEAARKNEDQSINLTKEVIRGEVIQDHECVADAFRAKKEALSNNNRLFIAGGAIIKRCSLIEETYFYFPKNVLAMKAYMQENKLKTLNELKSHLIGDQKHDIVNLLKFSYFCRGDYPLAPHEIKMFSRDGTRKVGRAKKTKFEQLSKDELIKVIEELICYGYPSSYFTKEMVDIVKRDHQAMKILIEWYSVSSQHKMAYLQYYDIYLGYCTSYNLPYSFNEWSVAMLMDLVADLLDYRKSGEEIPKIIEGDVSSENYMYEQIKNNSEPVYPRTYVGDKEFERWLKD